MKFISFVTTMLAVWICSSNRPLDEWQARFRAEVRAGISSYLPGTPQSAEARALLREVCALPDSAYAQPPR